MGLTSNATNPKKNLLKCERKNIDPSNYNISPTSDFPEIAQVCPSKNQKATFLGPGRVFGRYHLTRNNMDVSNNMGYPQNGWFVMENPC